MAQAATNKKETAKKTTSARSTQPKKSTATKAKKATTDVKVAAEESVAVEKVVEKVEAKEKRVFKATDMIECKSLRYGLMQHISKKSGNIYEWADYGDIVEVEYGDLLSLKSSKSKFLYSPWFMIMDDQLVEDWKLADIYEPFKEFDDVEEFLQSGATTIRKTLPNAPQGYKDLVTYTAADMIRNGTIDSIATINAIDEILGKNLTTLLGGR